MQQRPTQPWSAMSQDLSCPTFEVGCFLQNTQMQNNSSYEEPFSQGCDEGPIPSSGK
jgi:hypothetical protein